MDESRVNALEREEPSLAPGFAKRSDEERFLAALNHRLAPFDEEQYPASVRRYPSIYVYGAPRSGTTLVTQVLAATLDVGFVDHVMASFWRAPVTGARLSRKLFRGRPASPQYRSTYGRTLDVREPHEFGYFWTEMLKYHEPLQKEPEAEDSIDWTRLDLVLTNIAGVFERPVVYKSYLAGWHLRRIQSLRPEDLFVLVRRDPVENALSILAMREEYSGDLKAWPGLRPPEYRWLREEGPAVQAAGQVYFLDRSFQREIDAVSGRRVLEIDYESFCRNPSKAVEAIRQSITVNGAVPALVATPPERFEVHRRPEVKDRRKQVEQALRRWHVRS